MVVGKTEEILTEDLPVSLTIGDSGGGADSLAEVERRHIGSVLEGTDWNITRAAELLKIDRVTVYNKIKKYGLRR